ncbi:MAG: GNAT family N-acetyltransferase [Chloroflexi bacterium]|nr:GNAT family N-acetyltransferase [Chloroflexota bacterium]
MDLARSALRLRPLIPQDRDLLLQFVYGHPRTYYYPGWTSLQDWLAARGGWAMTVETRLVAALVVRPENDVLAWLRFFAARDDVPEDLAWRLLWRANVPDLAGTGVRWVAALGGRPWVDRWLRRQGFHRQVMLRFLYWSGASLPEAPVPSGFMLRPMKRTDLPAVYEVDRAAFPPLWRLRFDLLQHAFRGAWLALVVEETTTARVAGYAIFTPSPQGAHLARLAVHPQWQRQGLARALVVAGLRAVRRGSAGWVTVNTQMENQPALRLYQQLGFQEHTAVPVWLRRLDEQPLETHALHAAITPTSTHDHAPDRL